MLSLSGDGELGGIFIIDYFFALLRTHEHASWLNVFEDFEGPDFQIERQPVSNDERYFDANVPSRVHGCRLNENHAELSEVIYEELLFGNVVLLEKIAYLEMRGPNLVLLL